MPCCCWYDPGKENQKIMKDLCVMLVDHLKKLSKNGDPLGCEIQDAHKLIDHLYFGNCDEKSN